MWRKGNEKFVERKLNQGKALKINDSFYFIIRKWYQINKVTHHTIFCGGCNVIMKYDVISSNGLPLRLKNEIIKKMILF